MPNWFPNGVETTWILISIFWALGLIGFLRMWRKYRDPNMILGLGVTTLMLIHSSLMVCNHHGVTICKIETWASWGRVLILTSAFFMFMVPTLYGAMRGGGKGWIAVWMEPLERFYRRKGEINE